MLSLPGICALPHCSLEALSLVMDISMPKIIQNADIRSASIWIPSYVPMKLLRSSTKALFSCATVWPSCVGKDVLPILLLAVAVSNISSKVFHISADGVSPCGVPVSFTKASWSMTRWFFCIIALLSRGDLINVLLSMPNSVKVLATFSVIPILNKL